jgi:hypothetical protein
MKEVKIMYKKFKDCLFAPKKAADYINEPKKHTLIYLLILIFVYIIPLVMIAVFSKSNTSSLSNSFAEDFISAEQINYKISEGHLVQLNDAQNAQLIQSEIVIQDVLRVDSFYVFDLTGNEYKNKIDIQSEMCIIFLFTENEFSIINTSFESNTSSDLEYVANILNENILYKRTYSELNLINVDFSANKDTNTINFKNEISKVVSSIYENIKQKLLPLIIIVTMLIGVNSYFISVLFITALYKLLYGYLRLSFGKVFKAVILCSTPYVICAIIASLTGISFISLIGDILMIFYVNKALTVYKIKYDGGIPIPGYIRKMTETKDEERGNDDNEL